MSEANKEVVRGFLAEFDRRKEVPEELLAPSYSLYLNGDPAIDAAEHKQLSGAFFLAFPDMKHTIDHLVAEGDTVAGRGTIEGTHKGSFMDLAPTGKSIKMSWSATFRIAEGKIAEERVVLDQMGLMHQIGAMPVPAEAAT